MTFGVMQTHLSRAAGFSSNDLDSQQLKNWIDNDLQLDDSALIIEEMKKSGTTRGEKQKDDLRALVLISAELGASE